MSVFCNVIKPQGLEPFQFSTKSSPSDGWGATRCDAVAARVHFLALAVGDLAGAYNDIGIRRWFERKRTVLEGRAPAAVFRGKWQPEDPGPLQIRDLARALVASAAM